ncbi:MAG: NfeD family protein [Deltaproteobacteria bacterium]
MATGWEIWGTVALLLVGGELYTRAFLLLWPAIGAAGAAVGGALGLSLDGQLALFAVTSIALLIASRTLFLKLLSPEGRSLATGAEAIPGRSVKVLEPLEGRHAPGAVRLGGELWNAYTEDAARLAPGDAATVVRVDGLKLVVRRAEPDGGVAAPMTKDDPRESK